jgi:hypothetical protein
MLQESLDGGSLINSAHVLDVNLLQRWAHPFATAELLHWTPYPLIINLELQNLRPSSLGLQASGLNLESVVECHDAPRVNARPNEVTFSLFVRGMITVPSPSPSRYSLAAGSASHNGPQEVI